MGKSQALAQSSACDKVFLTLETSPIPALLQEPSVVDAPLKGLAFSVKDLFDMAGSPTLAGSTVLQGTPTAQFDCPAVARMNHAGALF